MTKVQPIWRTALQRGLQGDAAAHVIGSNTPGFGGDLPSRSSVETWSLARAHASVRADCDRWQGRRIWTSAEAGVAPASAFLRATLAGRLGVGVPVPRRTLDIAGAVVVGRVLSRGDARAALAVREELEPHLHDAFDAWRAQPGREAPLLVAGAMSAQILSELGSVTVAGLCLTALAGSCLAWDTRATLSGFPRDLAQSIGREMAAAPPCVEAAAGWIEWAWSQDQP